MSPPTGAPQPAPDAMVRVAPDGHIVPDAGRDPIVAGGKGPGAMTANPRVLVVDDDGQVRRLLQHILEDNGYFCVTAADTDEARRLIEDDRFALVLSDVSMPGGSGVDLLRLVIAASPDTAVVMISGTDDPAFADEVFALGAYGYIVKPFTASHVLMSVANALRRLTLEKENRRYAQRLERQLLERTELLAATFRHATEVEEQAHRMDEEAIHRLARVLEFRDVGTNRHSERMSRYASHLAERIGFDPGRCEAIRLGAIMHDIGKVAVPDGILFKEEALDPEEWEVIKRHPSVGHDILAGWGADLFSTSAQIALTHHERWDGHGYPNRLSGEAIPAEGRIVAIADSFDAITSDRPYRTGRPLEQAVLILETESGSQFDPSLVGPFVEDVPALAGIRDSFLD